MNIGRRFGSRKVLRPLSEVEAATIQLNDVDQLKLVFGWRRDPVLDDPETLRYQYPEDVNERRLRDAESMATVVRNTDARVVVDIGTARGHSAALLALNAPEAAVYTVNIPPEEFDEGGTLTTVKLSTSEIGSYYRAKSLKNIQQIYANTRTWDPEMADIDVAFIDGSHDSDFVVNDSIKMLERLGPGGFIMWHDFNPTLAANYHWIRSVCEGVNELFERGLIRGRIYQVRDSWVGIYRSPG